MPEWILNETDQQRPPLEMLRCRLPGVPAAYLRQLLRAGKVLLDGRPLAEQAPRCAGSRLRLPDSCRLKELLAAAPLLPEILLETPQLLVVLKPAGLAVHRGVGHEEDNLVRRVESLFKLRGAPFSAAPVHRLDRDTSGPLLFGKGRRATATLGRLFEQERVEKTYLALAGGELPSQGVLHSAVPAKGKLKEARTSFAKLAAGGGFSLLQLELHTGRTHQIRRQLAAAGHPLAGDRRYGGALLAGLHGVFLHCRRLSLTDPFDGTPLRVEVPLPSPLQRVLQGLGMILPLGA